MSEPMSAIGTKRTSACALHDAWSVTAISQTEMLSALLDAPA